MLGVLAVIFWQTYR